MDQQATAPLHVISAITRASVLGADAHEEWIDGFIGAVDQNPALASNDVLYLQDIIDFMGIVTALEAAHYTKMEHPVFRLLAADCADRVLCRERREGREPDLRSWAAVDVARRYARGEATAEDLAAARDAAAPPSDRWWGPSALVAMEACAPSGSEAAHHTAHEMRRAMGESQRGWLQRRLERIMYGE